MYQVWRILTLCAPNNEYSINRHEDWRVLPDDTFDTREEAEAYVIEKNLQHSEMVRFAHTIEDDEKPAFYRKFCFGDEENLDAYIQYRRFFVGYPPLAKIKQALAKDGIQVKK